MTKMGLRICYQKGLYNGSCNDIYIDDNKVIKGKIEHTKG